MKTKLIGIILALIALATSGCVTTSAAKKFAAFEALGVTEAQITGKFSNTEYRVVKEGGKRKAVLQHSNPWVVKLLIVRESDEAATPDEKK